MPERYLGRIQSGMSVCDARGSRLGSVARVHRYDAGASAEEPMERDSVDSEVLEVKTGVFGLGKHLYVPLGSIQEVVDDSVFLTVRGLDDELDQFKHKPEYLDRLH